MAVGVFVVDEVADFGLAAILEVLSTANALRDQVSPAAPAWAVTTLGLGCEVRSGAGHRIPTTPVSELDRLPDLLLVPAINVKGADALVQLVSAEPNRTVLELIARARSEGVELAAACTGTFFLAEAGVLDGVSATTSWWVAPAFRQRYPRVTLEEGHALRRAPGITTAGAAFSHVDLVLSLVRAQSPALAELVSRYLLIGTRLPQAAFAVPGVMAAHDPLTASFDRWIRQNLSRSFTVAAAAKALNISERSLQRATAATLGMTPVDFVHEIRLDHATHLLRSTQLSLEAIATEVGYRNVGTLRDLARRRRGMTLRELRRGPTSAGAAPDRVPEPD
ncbi:MAG: helix-turn-helix domain-containing protein [Sporichthya sp.]|nr:helix-turn-helix domain-containing protein [Sporichthya sp.]